jgi:hypothetical protein
MDWTVLGPMMAKLLADYLAAEQARSGLTTEEIFDRAGRKLDENEAKLLADIARLQGES